MKMENAHTIGHHGGNRWRVAAWGAASLLVLLPLVAMQFTDEVNWTLSDFVFAGILFGTVGLLYELTVRMSRNLAYRAGVGFALAAAFLIVWANGAVGMIGDEGSGYTQLFYGVIGVALIGSVAAMFRPAPMALAMLAAGIAHLGVAIGGLSADLRGAVISAILAGPWLLSAALFRLSARQQAAGPKA
jgi:hypothetical protein